MKTKTILQIATCIMMASLFVLPIQGASSTMKDDGTHVVIHSLPHDLENSPRSLSSIIIEATLYEEEGSIDVLIQNAGEEVSVMIENVTTGDNYYYLVSGNGTDSLFINASSGYWCILFTLADGTQYYGTFTI